MLYLKVQKEAKKIAMTWNQLQMSLTLFHCSASGRNGRLQHGHDQCHRFGSNQSDGHPRLGPTSSWKIRSTNFCAGSRHKGACFVFCFHIKFRIIPLWKFAYQYIISGSRFNLQGSLGRAKNRSWQARSCSQDGSPYTRIYWCWHSQRM